ncbi:DNA-directed RNA polymerase subunit P [Halorutilales archaeon Cl-col2-1]|nr:DNA-directed RNA polymerase subunit P [Halobacteria archaeon]
MAYRCARCKRSIELEGRSSVRCPYCGHRILLKERGGGIKKVDVH